jgi:hypothetical protein
MSVSETVRGIVQESVESMALASGINGSNLQPRCRICRNDSLRTKVNDLLTTGASYAMVLRALGDVNATREQRDRVTIDSIRNHAARHFPVQNVARATYREILERRANDNSVDFIESVATAITPLAVLETIMMKWPDPDRLIHGYESLAAHDVGRKARQDHGDKETAQPRAGRAQADGGRSAAGRGQGHRGGVP